MLLVYTKNEYKVYRTDDGHIIVNTLLEFDEGHTHIKNLKLATYLIDLCVSKSMPHHLQPYMLVSLSRITDDEHYRNELLDLRDRKVDRCKSNKFYNSRIKRSK